MRLVVEKWILTTLKKENDQNNISENNENFTLNQRLEQEQNLYDSSRSLSDTDSIPLPILDQSTRSRTNKTKSTIDSSTTSQTNRKSLNERILNEMERTSSTHKLYIEEEINESEKIMSKIEDFLSDTNTATPESPTQCNLKSINELSNHLNKVLDLYSYRDAQLFLEEFLKLDYYLNSENDLLSTSDDIYFLNQDQIIHYLNQTLKIKLFRLSQSSGLFDELKKKLYSLLKSRLSINNLNDSIAKFEIIEHEYLNLFEQVKSRLKLKMSKLQKCSNVWNDFESDCKNLDNLFNSSQNSINCSLKYRSTSIEINNLLNRLKEQLNQLASILNEIKYFELKNIIIIYELKFKKFKECNEITQNSIDNKDYQFSSSTHIHQEELTEKSIEIKINHSNSSKHSTPIQRPQNYFHTIPISYHDSSELRKRRLETSDKSTATIHNECTQTENLYSSELDDAVVASSPVNLMINSPLIRDQDLRSMDRLYSNNSYRHHTSGKKLLLEAYLRNNNDNLESNGSCSSSSKTDKNKKCLTTRESGIGTTNDDEGDSIQNDHYFKEIENEKLSVCDEEDKLVGADGFVLSNQKRVRKRLKSNKNKEDFKKSNLNKLKSIASVSTSSTSSASLNKEFTPQRLNTEKFTRSKPMNKKSMEEISNSFLAQSQSSSSTTVPDSASSRTLNKILRFFLIFLIPLLCILLVLVYFIYRTYLNPSCCDFKRNYLFINVVS